MTQKVGEYLQQAEKDRLLLTLNPHQNNPILHFALSFLHPIGRLMAVAGMQSALTALYQEGDLLGQTGRETLDILRTLAQLDPAQYPHLDQVLPDYQPRFINIASV
ncbi:MAG: hypothetical protein WCF84_07090 [Anaerolineae bacterium]